MRLTSMRYKDYTWPHNPEIYTVENRRRVAVHKIPFGSCVFQELGTYRILRGGRVLRSGRLRPVPATGRRVSGGRTGAAGSPGVDGPAGLLCLPEGHRKAFAGLRAVQLRVLGGLRRLRRRPDGERQRRCAASPGEPDRGRRQREPDRPHYKKGIPSGVSPASTARR